MTLKVSLSIHTLLAVLISVGTAASTVSENDKVATSKRQYSLSPKTQTQLFSKMIWVEGGSFTMGSDHEDAAEREKPAHTVILDSFYIASTELTQGVFEELMGWNNSYFPCAQCPVNNLSWLNIQLFIERLNHTTGKRFRLVMEVEADKSLLGGH